MNLTPHRNSYGRYDRPVPRVSSTGIQRAFPGVMVAGTLIALIAFAGCLAPADDQLEPEATSFLGEPLYRLDIDPAADSTMRADLADARARKNAESESVDGFVWVGRRLAYLGRYRDAIAEYTSGLDRYPEEPRLLRHRGHRFITIRKPDRAISDLSRAAELTAGQADQVERDGQPNPSGIPISTLQTNIWYHLGLAHYLKGEFDDAATAFRMCLELAQNDDMRVASADWLFMALYRDNRPEEASDAVSFVREDMDIVENHAYHQRLLMYRGMVRPDSLRAMDRDALTLATLGYGVANWRLVQGDTTEAVALYRDIVSTGYWPAFGVIAAEADLARLTGRVAD